MKVLTLTFSIRLVSKGSTVQLADVPLLADCGNTKAQLAVHRLRLRMALPARLRLLEHLIAVAQDLISVLPLTNV